MPACVVHITTYTIHQHLLSLPVPLLLSNTSLEWKMFALFSYFAHHLFYFYKFQLSLHRHITAFVSRNRLVKMKKEEKKTGKNGEFRVQQTNGWSKEKNHCKFVNKLRIFYLNAQCTLLLLASFKCLHSALKFELLPNWIINRCTKWSKCGCIFICSFRMVKITFWLFVLIAQIIIFQYEII